MDWFNLLSMKTSHILPQYLLIHHVFINATCIKYEFSDVAVVGAESGGIDGNEERFCSDNMTVNYILEATNSSERRITIWKLEDRIVFHRKWSSWEDNGLEMLRYKSSRTI